MILLKNIFNTYLFLIDRILVIQADTDKYNWQVRQSKDSFLFNVSTDTALKFFW